MRAVGAIRTVWRVQRGGQAQSCPWTVPPVQVTSGCDDGEGSAGAHDHRPEGGSGTAGGGGGCDGGWAVDGGGPVNGGGGGGAGWGAGNGVGTGGAGGPGGR